MPAGRLRDDRRTRTDQLPAMMIGGATLSGAVPGATLSEIRLHCLMPREPDGGVGQSTSHEFLHARGNAALADTKQRLIAFPQVTYVTLVTELPSW